MKRYFISLSLFACIFSSSVVLADNAVSEKQVPVDLVKVFGALPSVTRVRLSPSGNKIAYVQNIVEPSDLSLLRTYDMAEQKVYNLLQSDNEDVKINWFTWANDEQLIVSAKYGAKSQGQRYYKTRLYAMKFDGEGEEPVNLIDWRRLAKLSRRTNHVPQFQDSVIDLLRDDEKHILIALDSDVPHLPSVYRVDIDSGRMERVIRGKRQIREWYTDLQGNVRAGLAMDYDTGEVKVLLHEDDDWRPLFEYNAMTDKPTHIAGFGADPNELYYKAYKGDYKGLFKLNLKTGKTTEMLWKEGFDVDGSLIYSQKHGMRLVCISRRKKTVNITGMT